MRIILQAFSRKLVSGIMDIPESSGTKWDMILTKPLSVISGFSGEKISERGTLQTLCTFEWIGKVDMATGARIYDLIDIRKI